MKMFLPTLILLSISSTLAFYLPGMAPVDYKKGGLVPIYANSLRSSVTELPYDFYHKKLHFPRDEQKTKYEREGLGAVLKGDRLVSTDFQVKMLEDDQCAYLGTAHLTDDESAFLYDRISEDYYYTFELDDLPGLTFLDKTEKDDDGVNVTTALPMGSKSTSENGEHSINTFFTFTIFYHQVKTKERAISIGDEIVIEKQPVVDQDLYRVVGFEVGAESRALSKPEGDNGVNCKALKEKKLPRRGTTDIHYFYSVRFQPSETLWMHRWDRILTSGKAKIHWYNIAYSLILVIFLVFMVCTILLRALHRDISRYNLLEAQEEAHEDYGWKLIHGDVFRTPPRYMALSVILGNGAQLFFMSATTLLFACFGFLSPSRRGSMLTAIIVTYVFSGIVAGYVSARIYKMFGGEAWKKNVLLTAFAAPGALFLVFLILNFILIGAGSSAAVPFTTMLVLIVLWFLISVPLCFIGAFRAFKQPRIEYPVKTNQIPRQVPTLVWYMRAIPSCLMGGIMPFGAVFLELYYIMNSIWSSQFYYVFGFLFIIGTILILTCAAVSILLCYFQLCEEDYRWWWRAFFSSGTSGLYVFLNSIIYFSRSRSIVRASTFFIYFGWSLVMSVMFSFVTGFIGFMACLVFVKKIYGSIKID